MPRIVICVGSSCFARGNERNVAFAEKWLGERGLRDDVDVSLSGCLCTGNCARGPVVSVDGKTYAQVDEGVMRDILTSLFPDTPKV